MSVLIVLVVALLGALGNRWLNRVRMIFQVWHLVEKMGIIEGWAGYEKLALAMTEFRERFYEKYGREPSAGDEGWAVKILTWLCKIEDKEPIEIEDFSEGSEAELEQEDSSA